jgi:mono/diheme cytochrome c family protein
MPDYALSDDEALALSVFVLANRNRQVARNYLRPSSAKERALHDGEQIFVAHNCAGCHEFLRHRSVSEDGEVTQTPVGGWVRHFYAEQALAPPPLTTAGRKLQSRWLWDFLRSPTTIRSFLPARMPNFALPDSEIDALAKWWALRDDQPYPIQHLEMHKLSGAERNEAQRLYTQLRCQQCHPGQGSPLVHGKPGADLAPDLALAPKRLKPDWVRAWLRDPQTLQPNTRMPTFFVALDEEDPSQLSSVPGFFGDDASRQIEALTELVMDLP